MDPVEMPELDSRSLGVLWQKVNNLERMSGSSTEFGGGGGNGGGGGDMELIKRVDNLEKSLLETREKVVRIEGMVESIKQHGSSKEDVQKLYTAIEALSGRIESKIEGTGTKIETMGRTMIQWAIGTGLTTAAIAFTAAKLIHP